VVGTRLCRPRIPVLLVALTMLVPALLAAQEPTPCEVGDRVRVTALMLREHAARPTLAVMSERGTVPAYRDRARGRVVAMVANLDTQALTVEPETTHAWVVVPWDSIRTLERSLGRMPRRAFVVRSAALGALVYAVPFTALVAMAGSDDCAAESGWGPCFEKRDWPTVAAFTGALGAASGAFAGLILPRPERWQRLPIPVAVDIGTSADGGVVLSVTRPF
jgi:hypothetical protein